MYQALIKFCQDDCAISAIEYALLGSLIAVVIVTAITSLGTQLLALYTHVRDQVILATP